MYGQTTSMYKTLVDAYHTVLVKMRENNLVLPMAMVMAIVGGGAVAQKAQAATVYWAPSINNAATPWDGTWDTGTSNWNSLNPAASPATVPYGVQTWAAGDTAIFARPPAIGATDNGPPVVGGVVPPAPYTVTVTENVTAGGMQFTHPGYILTGTAAIVLVPGSHITLGTAPSGLGTGIDATISATLASNGGIVKDGEGTLYLAGTNNGISSTTGFQALTVNAGKVQIGDASGAGTSGTLGTGAVTLNGATTQIRLARANTATVSNAIGGTGSLAQVGTGTTILTGGNSYSGGTTITRGTLQIGTADNASSLGSGNVVNDANLTFRNAGTVANAISGAGNVENIGGSVILSGANGYTGKTTVTAGTMRIQNMLALSGGNNWDADHIQVRGGATLEVRLNELDGTGFTTARLAQLVGIGANANGQDPLTLLGFNNNAILALDTGAADFVHGGGIGDPTYARNGATAGPNKLNIRKLGTATLTFNGGVSYTGTTTFVANPGAHDAFNPDTSTIEYTSGTLTGNIARTGTDDYVGNLIMSGANADAALANGDVLTLSGTNTYTGTTTVNSGTLQFAKRASLYNGGFITVTGDTFGTYMWTDDKIQVASGATLALNVGGSDGFDAEDVEDIYLWSNGFAAGAILGLDTSTAAVPFGSTVHQFVYDRSLTDTFNGSLGLAKRGEGALILTEDNFYTGPTYIYAGILKLGTGGATGGIDFSSSITNNGTLMVDLSRTDVALNNIHGTGGISQVGSGTTTMNGLNDYKGDTWVWDGTLRAGSTTAFGDNYTAATNPASLGTNAQTVVSTHGTLDLDGFDNTIGTLLGQGQVTLGGATLTVAGGRRVEGAPGVTAFEPEFSGKITGSGNLVMDASAQQKADDIAYGYDDAIDPRQVLVLSGDNDYTGTTTVTYGTLQVGNGGLTGTLGQGDITVNSIPETYTGTQEGAPFTMYGLDFNRGGTLTLSNAIHGAGTIGITGSGTVELAGTSDHTGEISVKSGILKVTGAMQSDITVDPTIYTLSTTSGQTTTTTEYQRIAMLAGNGSTTGVLGLAGGSFILGAAADSGLAFKANGGAFVDTTFLDTYITTTSGTTSTTTFLPSRVMDKVIILDGSGTAGTGLQSIDVLEYAGFSPGAANFDGSTFRNGIVGDTSSKITLTYDRAARVWNSGLGTWDNLVSAPWTGTDTLDGTGANLAKKFSSGDFVLFDDTGAGAGGTRTVNLNTQVAPGEVVFDNSTSRYVVTGLGGITGITNLIKNGTEVTVLDTDNTYTGTTTVNAGILRVGNGGMRGMLGQGDVTLNGNSVLLFGRGDDSSANALSTDYSPTTTVTRPGNWHPVLVNNHIGGTGSVGQVGTRDNIVVLSGNNTYTGTTSVNSGALAAGSDTAFGINSATLVDLGAILWLNDGVQDHDISLGSLSGGGFVVADGVGRGNNLTLTFAGNAAGSSTVFNGQFSDINRSYNFTVGLTTNDRIRITDVNGNGINYQNERSVDGLLVDSAGTHKEVGGTWVDSTSGTATAPAPNLQNKTWMFDGESGRWYKVMYAPVLGNGWNNRGMAADLIKEGDGTQTLAGDNTYTGHTFINGGILQVGNGGSLANRHTDLLMGGQLLDAHGTLGQTSGITIAADATLAFNRVDNALVWGADAWVGNYLYAGGKDEDLTYTWPDRVRGALVVSADISGDGTIRQIGTGTTTLTGNQSEFTGAVVVDAGTLRIGDEIIDTIIDLAHTGTDTTDHLHQGLQAYGAGEALGDGSVTNTVTVNSGGTLAFNLANDYTETHAITGAGNVAHTGSGVQTMAGDSTYTGKTTAASTVARYRTAGPNILTNLTVVDSDILHHDLVIGGTLRAGVDSVLNTAGTSAVSGAFGVQSVVSVNAGATLDLNGRSQYIGALHSDGSLVRDTSGNWVEDLDPVTGENRHALTDGNSRVAEYAPSAEQQAGTPSNLLGTAGTAVVNFWKEVDNSYHSSGITVGVVDIGSATLVVGDGNKSGNYAGVLTGAGTFTKIGTGTQILSGDSDGPVSGRDYVWVGSRSSTPASFSGEVHIKGGTLQLGDGTFDPLGNSHGAIGTGHVAVDFGATFAFNRADDTVLAIVNQISGRGNVRQFGPGTTVLAGNNTYSGITQVDNGILRAGGDLAFGSPVTTSALTVLNTIGGAVVNGGMLDLNNFNIQFGSLNGAGGIVNLGTSPTSSLTIGWFGNANDAYSGVIQGAGKVAKTGTGIQTLAGANTYTGATHVVAGTLQAGVATVGGINPTSGAFGVNSAMTLGGTMYGSPTTAIVDLNGFDQTLGSLASTADLANTVTNTSIVNDATLTLTGANAAPVNFQGTLSDGASKKLNIVKTGAGTQTFSGQFTYSGTTTVNGGKLVLDYAQMITASQKGALSLGGGEVQFDNLGTLNPSFVSTTITATNSNKLTLGAGWGAFTSPDISGTYTGTGHVNLGTLNYVSGALDVSNIATTAGWVQISGLDGSTEVADYTNQTFLFNGIITANGGQNLVGTDGTGFLITAQTADFSQGGAIGDPLGPTVTAATAIRLISTGHGGNQINQPITLYNAGVTDVTTVLNAYTGEAPGQPNRTDGLAVETLSIGAGNTLRLAAQGAILSVAGSDLILSGGTLTAGGADDIDGTITVNAGIRSASDPIEIKVASAIADNGTGSVGLTKVGLGTLTIATPGGLAWDLANPASHPATGSTYTGTTMVAQGTLKVGADYAMSWQSQVVLNAGVFTPGASGSAGTWVSPVLDLDNHSVRIGSLQDGDLGDTGGTTGAVVSLGTGGLTLGEDNLNATFSGVITSGSTSKDLIKVGSGKQTLAGDNTLAGTVKIYGGTLQIGNGGTTGNFGSSVTAVNTGTTTANGTLAFNRGDLAPVVFTPTITGFGGVAQNGTATIVLSGANNYQGATAVNSGILQAGVASTANSGAFGVRSAVNVASGATLDLNGFNNAIGSLSGAGGVALGNATLTTGTNNLDASFAGTISGAGGLTKTGTGTQTLSGVNTYGGATTVSEGTLALDYAGGSNRLSAASSLVLQGGSLVFQNLGNKTQSFASTMVSLAVPTTPFILSQTGWTSGVVDLGNLGGVSGIASWVGSLDIQDLNATPTWIKTSDSRYASTLNWSGKATSGGQRVATDSNGYFIMVTTTDYSQGGAIGDPAGPSFANTDVVRLISTGYGGVSGPNVANAPITLFANGTTDVGGIINAYDAGTTNPATNTAVTLQIGASQVLRVGSFGVSNSGAGTDLAITGGSITSSTPTLAINAGTKTVTVDSAIVDNGLSVIGLVQNGGTTVLTGTNTYTGGTTVNNGTLQVGIGTSAGVLGSGAVVVNAGATLAFNHSGADALTQTLTGSGTLAQDGADALTVSNAAGFTGHVAVNTGTLDFNSAATLAGATTAAGATLNFNADETVTSISNAGTLTTGGILTFTSMVNSGSFQIGATGRVDLTAANPITGSGTVTNAGIFNMAAGSGTTNAVINNGTMNVAGAVNTGALTFNAGSLLALANGNAVITSSGPVIVNAGAGLLIQSASGFEPGSPQRIIDGTSATGTFTIDGASAAPGSGLHWVNIISGGDIYLGTQYTLAPGGGANTQREATSEALITIGESVAVNPDIQGAITYLAGLTGNAYGDALDRLSGHDRAAVDSVTQSHTLTRGQNILQFAQMQLINDETVVSRSTDRAMRATALGDLEYGDIEDVYGLQFFVHAGQVNESRDRQTTGVLATEATGSIFTVGVHNQLTDNLNIGIAFTYDQTDITSGNGLGESDATTYGLDLYFSHLIDESQRWFIAGVVGGGISTYDNSRSGIMPGNLTATGSANGTQFHVAGQLGYRADVWQDAILTPYAGLSMVRNQVDAYAESLPGAPGLALSYEDHTSTATEAVLGLNFAQGIHLSGGYQITPSLGLAWHHQLGNTDSNTVSTHFAGASGTAFNTYLGGLPDDAVEIQGAITVQIPGGLKVFIDGRHYESMGSSNGASQDRIGGGLRYDF